MLLIASSIPFNHELFHAHCLDHTCSLMLVETMGKNLEKIWEVFSRKDVDHLQKVFKRYKKTSLVRT